MDDSRFDDLIRSLATGTSRRGLLKGILGGIAAGFGGLATVAPTPVTAARQPNGAPCRRHSECTSFGCAAGVCCDTACTGQCESCATGTCLPVSGAPVGNKPACPGEEPCRAVCDGRTRTHCAGLPGGETACGASTCAGGFQTTYACGGNGTCTPTTASCGLYVCGATACLTSCMGDADCAGVAFCAAGICQGDRVLGAPCESPDQCQSGFCAQGICCAEPCDGQCVACNLPGNVGVCSAAAGVACDDGDACTEIDVCQHNGDCAGMPIVCAQPRACEEPGRCNATTGQCNYGLKPVTVECRPAAGPCDVAEFCTGASPDCPPDIFRPNTFACRSAAGPCDVAELCSGSAAACPPDRFHPSTFECRPSTGACDPAERCTGGSATCPDDVVMTACGQTCCNPGVECTMAGTCGACGGADEPCCLGSIFGDCHSGLECNADAICGLNICGKVGQPCCFDSGCDGGLVCADTGICQPDLCGGDGEACCVGARCDDGFVCDTIGGVCRPCGNAGQSCCAAVGRRAFCHHELGCAISPDVFALGTCGACGGAGEPCCLDLDFGTCDSGLECNAVGICGVNICGKTGQPCCFNGDCDGGLICTGTGGLFTCVPCGGSGEPCCADLVCNGTLECGRTFTCGACGSEGQVCCFTSPLCDAGLTCDFDGDSSCVRCGGLNQLCCAGSACTGGLNCDLRDGELVCVA